MITELTTLGWGSTGLLAGASVGLAFGTVQRRAQLRHERLLAADRWHGVQTLLPGSGRRVAFLLLGLVLIQILCPALFKDGTQWWVSAGVTLGYGIALWRRVLSSKRHGEVVAEK